MFFVKNAMFTLMYWTVNQIKFYLTKYEIDLTSHVVLTLGLILYFIIISTGIHCARKVRWNEEKNKSIKKQTYLKTF